MFGIGIAELSIILVLVLIIFGAGKLPEIGSALGSGIRSFKTGISGDGEKIENLDPGKIEHKED